MKNTKTVFVFSLINLLIVTSAVSFLKLGSELGENEKQIMPQTAPTVSTNLSPTIVVTPSTTTGSVVATPTRDTRCLVVVDGLQYNLTQFVKLHSGGDIFQCGTDMSSSFHNQHPNNYLDILAKYRI